MGEMLYVVMTNIGEMLMFGTTDTDPVDDTNEEFLEITYPAAMMPQQNGQLGFQMAFPLSDFDKPLKIRKSIIDKISEPNKQIKDAYDQWQKQVRAQLSGIVVPNAQVTTPGDLRAQGQ